MKTMIKSATLILLLLLTTQTVFTADIGYKLGSNSVFASGFWTPANAASTLQMMQSNNIALVLSNGSPLYLTVVPGSNTVLEITPSNLTNSGAWLTGQNFFLTNISTWLTGQSLFDPWNAATTQMGNLSNNVFSAFQQTTNDINNSIQGNTNYVNSTAQQTTNDFNSRLSNYAPLPGTNSWQQPQTMIGLILTNRFTVWFATNWVSRNVINLPDPGTTIVRLTGPGFTGLANGQPVRTFSVVTSVFNVESDESLVLADSIGSSGTNSLDVISSLTTNVTTNVVGYIRFGDGHYYSMSVTNGVVYGTDLGTALP